MTLPSGVDEKLLDRLGLAVPAHHELAILVLRRLGGAPPRPSSWSPSWHPPPKWTRAALLLRRALGRSAVVIVRAAPDDPFHPEGWWRNRSNSREVITESGRWINSLLLGDLWRE